MRRFGNFIKPGSGVGFGVAALLGMLIGLACPASAQPDWWQGSGKSLLDAAIQNNKSMVLYFESKGSEACEQMEMETWPALNKADTAKFLWKRCAYGDAKDKSFFETFAVSSTPEIVVVDAQRRERGRLKGFIGPDLIMSVLTGFPSYDDAGGAKVFSYGDGRIFTADQALAKGFDASQHIYYLREDFDAVADLKGLNRGFFEPYMNPAETLKIEPGEGYFQTNGLLITGIGAKITFQQKPAVVMRVNLAQNFSEADIVLGYVEVRLRVRVNVLPEEGMHEIIALTVLPAAAKAPTVPEIQSVYRKDSVFILRNFNNTSWKDLMLRTRQPIRLRDQAVWLNMWIDSPTWSFTVDDIRVRILTEEQAKEEVVLSSAPDPNAIIGRGEQNEMGHLFKLFDVNKDRQLEKSEFPARRKELIKMSSKKSFDQWFAERDQNKSGYLEPDEFRE